MAETAPLFSVVMPSFNTVAFLRHTIETILAQDYPHVELVIADGGSTDGTLDVLRSFEGRIIWVSEPDNGQCDAINKAIERASGSFFFWANADDPMAPGALSHVARLLQDNSAPRWVVAAADLIDGKGKQYGTRVTDRIDDTTFRLWALKWFPTQSVFWNRAMWDAAGPFDTALHYVMDLGLWSRMHATAPAILSDRVVGSYRMHADAKSFARMDKARAERKRLTGDLLEQEIRAAMAAGPDAFHTLTQAYGQILDELADQAVALERMKRHRIMGPVLKAAKKRGSWVPDLDL